MGWPQIIAAVASVALQKAATDKQQSQQKSLADQMTQYRLKKSDESTAATNKFLDTQRPEARAATTANAQQELAQGLDQSIGAAQAFEKPQNFAGKVTSDYTNRAATDEATLSSRLKTLVGNLSVMGAPARRDFDTSLKFGDAAGTVAGANKAADAVSDRYTTAINNVQPDPFLSFASQLAQGYGMATAGGGGATPFNVTGTGLKLPAGAVGSLGLKPATGSGLGLKFS